MVSKTLIGSAALILILLFGALGYLLYIQNPNIINPNPSPTPFNGYPTPAPTNPWSTQAPAPTNTPNAPTATFTISPTNPSGLEISASNNGYMPYTYTVYVDTAVVATGTMTSTTQSVTFSPALAVGQHSIYVKVADSQFRTAFTTPQVVQVSTNPTGQPTGVPTAAPTQPAGQPNTAFMYQALLITYYDDTTQWYIPPSNQYTILPPLSGIYNDLQTNKMVKNIGAYIYWGVQGDDKAIKTAYLTYEARLCIYANDQSTPVKDFGWMPSTTVSFPNGAYQSITTNVAYQAMSSSSAISAFNQYISTGQYYYIVTIRNAMLQVTWNDNTAAAFQLTGQSNHDIRWHFSYQYTMFNALGANTLDITGSEPINTASNMVNPLIYAIAIPIVALSALAIGVYVTKYYRKR